MSPPSSAVAVTVEGDDAASGERTFVGTQRLDFQPGERVDFRFEAAEMGAPPVDLLVHPVYVQGR